MWSYDKQFNMQNTSYNIYYIHNYIIYKGLNNNIILLLNMEKGPIYF